MMNGHEYAAWRSLVGLGARPIELGGKPGLDVRPIRITSDKRMSDFTHAFNEVAGRSGAVRRHLDRRGSPVFLVTDDERVRVAG